MFRRLMKGPALESGIERTCGEHARARGYKFVKVTSVVGFPDRMLILPQGRVVFVELKRPDEEPTRIQYHRHGELLALSHRVFVIDSVGAFDNLMDALEAEWHLRPLKETKHWQTPQYQDY